MKNVRSYAALAAVLALGLTSCSNKATEEQMKTLNGLDSQRAGLQSDLQRAQDNLRDAQGKLANANRDAQDCTNDTQAAQAGLRNWPNVWADSTEWRVMPTVAPQTEKMESSKKMHKTHHM